MLEIKVNKKTIFAFTEFTVWWRDKNTNRCKMPLCQVPKGSYLALRASNSEVKEDSNVEVNFELSSEK